MNLLFKNFRENLVTLDCQDRQKQGVIAVLFLFVVAFIFAALSLSMQSGQIVERRVTADQAADSAAYAFASKSAQGLNYISANNLAIAGVSHMAGAIHLAADWTVLAMVFLEAKSFCNKPDGATLPEGGGDYQKPYEWLRPLTKLYFKAGIGLTRINTAVKSSFPYLGMIDAIEIAGANAPSSVIIPFGAKKTSQPAASGNTVLDKIQTGMKNLIKSVKPSFEGLRTINSDETFCIAYKAGKLAVNGNDYHKVSEWASLGLAGTPLSGIDSVLSGLSAVFDVMGFLGNIVGMRVGFSGCGFGEEGEGVGNGEIGNQILIAGFVSKILSGPVAGREIDLELPFGGKPIILRPHANETIGQLTSDLNREFYELCVNNARRGYWKINQTLTGFNQLESFPSADTGVCMVPQKTGKKYYERKHSLPQFGTPNNHAGDPKYIELRSYEPKCFGTLLFEWESYAGLRSTRNPSDSKKPIVIPSNASHPDVKVDDNTTEICPSFNASDTTGRDELWFPKGPPDFSSKDESIVGLNRGDRSFLAPVFARLKTENPTENPPEVFTALANQIPIPQNKPRPALIRTEAAPLILKYLQCASNASKCPFQDKVTGAGYFENEENVKFYPNIDSLNWMCPASGETFTAEQVLAYFMKFDSYDGNRWMGNFRKLQIWHDDHIDKFVKRMKCNEWAKFFNGKEKAGTPVSSPPMGTNSNDYCNDGAHMCWQRDMQDNTGVGIPKLKEGTLSFTLVGKDGDEAVFDDSLHYAVLSVFPLRFDGKADIVGRNDGSSMVHCPPNMDVNHLLAGGASVQVCDIQPVVGFINRVITNDAGSKVDVNKDDDFGVGDVNLASGGALEATSGGTLGAMGFMSIAQSGVLYEENKLADDASRPPEPKAGASPSKNYRMFWPSWKPIFEPSRVMSRILPNPLSDLVED